MNDEQIIEEAKARFAKCREWEAEQREEHRRDMAYYGGASSRPGFLRRMVRLFNEFARAIFPNG